MERTYETVAEALAEVQATCRLPLTLGQALRIGDKVLSELDPVWSYEILGLPPAEHVSLVNVHASSADGGRWEIRRFTDRVR